MFTYLNIYLIYIYLVIKSATSTHVLPVHEFFVAIFCGPQTIFLYFHPVAEKALTAVWLVFTLGRKT